MIAAPKTRQSLLSGEHKMFDAGKSAGLLSGKHAMPVPEKTAGPGCRDGK